MPTGLARLAPLTSIDPDRGRHNPELGIIGDVAAPAGVGLLGGEVLPDQVGGVDRAPACDGGALPGSWVAPVQARGAHQPPDPLAGHAQAAHDEL
ncbi:MAG TPA: hypothetical protein VNT24_00865, partial [Propionibacteriaceae bacterium]|nr:hypothetical protein [Propionibacteriaceae bacterium]